MQTLADLERTLRDLDGRGYKAYRAIAGRFSAGPFTLFVDRVQGDPFATPSTLRLVLPRAWHGLPEELAEPGPRRVALCDHRCSRPSRPARTRVSPGCTLRQLLLETFDEASARGLWAFDPRPDLALPRIFELAAAVSRLRSLRVAPKTQGAP